MEKNKTKGLLSDGLIIAFLTSYSYFLSYRYQDGYYSYFNIPSFLIEISIETILTSCISILAFLIIIYAVVSLFTSIIPSKTDPTIVRLIFKYVYFFLISAIYFVLGSYKKGFSYYIFSPVFFMLIIDLVIPLVTQKEMKGYKNKVIAEYLKTEDQIASLDNKYSINMIIARKFNHLPLVLSLAIMLSLISYQLGGFNAFRQVDFTITNDNIVILGTYDKNFIVKELNISNKTLESSFNLISDKSNISFTKKQIGPLIVK